MNKDKKKQLKMFFQSVFQKLGEVETDSAKLIFEGIELKAGMEVYIESDGETSDYIPAPDGDYKTRDGKVIKVADGKVSEIVDDMAEVATQQEMAEEETVENPTNDGSESDTEAIVNIRKEVNELYARVDAMQKMIEELTQKDAVKNAEEQFSDVEVKDSKKTLAEKRLSYLKK